MTAETDPKALPAAASFRLSMSGTGALLLDVAGETFSEDLQDRVHALARAMLGVEGVAEAVPGMNNLLVTFDPLGVAPEAIEDALMEKWPAMAPDPLGGRTVEVPVRYGGAGGPDLAALADHAGISAAEVVERHASALYRVAAVGAMPGFVYLSGLDPKLACSRRANPRGQVPEGAVMIGGAQAGIMPVTAPSGWHVLGQTATKLFDPFRDPPATFRPGDRIRFVAESVSS
ncbi:MAG: 5-oxoprolinase subunit PxpB [Methylobacterium mesophilicum]|nr:5-oxoprolinase subunit PxpB [Methylobacterium mesophilicum]